MTLNTVIKSNTVTLYCYVLFHYSINYNTQQIRVTGPIADLLFRYKHCHSIYKYQRIIFNINFDRRINYMGNLQKAV